MTHIGYVYVYHIVNNTGVVIDSHKIAHLFVSDTQKKYSRFQFVTYEGEGDVELGRAAVVEQTGC